MFEKVKEIIAKQHDEEIFKVKIPRHIAITMNGIQAWAAKNRVSLEDANKRSSLILKSTVKSQIKLGIPVLTFYLLPASMSKEAEGYEQALNSIISLFSELSTSDIIHENKVKVSVIGKWYSLPQKMVDSIKKVIEDTKDYDSFFINFCVNYDGQQEIVDACKIIAMSVKSGKLDPEMITAGTIKEHLYSSYFIPPELIIKNGMKNVNTGLLLWDSAKAKLYFTKKFFPDFDKAELMDAIKEFQRWN